MQPQPHSNRFGPSLAFFGAGASAAAAAAFSAVGARISFGAAEKQQPLTSEDEPALSSGHSQIGSKVNVQPHASDDACFQQKKHREAYKALKGERRASSGHSFGDFGDVADLDGTELEEPFEDEDIYRPTSCLIKRQTKKLR